MSRFRGEYQYSVDKKGRVNIPAKFRKALSPEAGEVFAICRAPGKCLRAYPIDAWDKYETELALRPQTKEALRYLRMLNSTLTDSKLDSQGRIMLSAKQMKIAGIEKNVILVGNYGYIEIWDLDSYTKYIDSDDDFDDMFEHSVQAGLRS